VPETLLNEISVACHGSRASGETIRQGCVAGVIALAYSRFVYVAYVDESGDDGTGKGASKSYALGCVMFDAVEWTATFDQMIGFRRFVRARFNIPMRAELKANYLLRIGGPLRERPLSEMARFKLYRALVRIQPKLGMTTFAVVIDKPAAMKKFATARPTSDVAWEYLLQRLERRAAKEKTEILVVHDEGDALMIRKRARNAQRAGTAGSNTGIGVLNVPFTRLLDDPVARNSQQSYFLQLADLNAYAAFRRLYPPPSRPVESSASDFVSAFRAIITQGRWWSCAPEEEHVRAERWQRTAAAQAGVERRGEAADLPAAVGVMRRVKAEDARARAEADARRAESETQDRERKDRLMALGRSFARKAKAAGVPTDGVRVRVGTRRAIERKGLFRQREVVAGAYETRDMWVVRGHYQSGGRGGSDPWVSLASMCRVPVRSSAATQSKKAVSCIGTAIGTASARDRTR
jgi:hypothetical protein